jgi:hypothetical protein
MKSPSQAQGQDFGDASSGGSTVSSAVLKRQGSSAARGDAGLSNGTMGRQQQQKQPQPQPQPGIGGNSWLARDPPTSPHSISPVPSSSSLHLPSIPRSSSTAELCALGVLDAEGYDSTAAEVTSGDYGEQYQPSGAPPPGLSGDEGGLADANAPRSNMRRSVSAGSVSSFQSDGESYGLGFSQPSQFVSGGEQWYGGQRGMEGVESQGPTFSSLSGDRPSRLLSTSSSLPHSMDILLQGYQGSGSAVRPDHFLSSAVDDRRLPFESGTSGAMNGRQSHWSSTATANAPPYNRSDTDLVASFARLSAEENNARLSRRTRPSPWDAGGGGGGSLNDFVGSQTKQQQLPSQQQQQQRMGGYDQYDLLEQRISEATTAHLMQGDSMAGEAGLGGPYDTFDAAAEGLPGLPPHLANDPVALYNALLVNQSMSVAMGRRFPGLVFPGPGTGMLNMARVAAAAQTHQTTSRRGHAGSSSGGFDGGDGGVGTGAGPATMFHSRSMQDLRSSAAGIASPPQQQSAQASRYMPADMAEDPGDGKLYRVNFKRGTRTFLLGKDCERNLKPGDYVKVEADRGEDLGMILSVVVDAPGPWQPHRHSGTGKKERILRGASSEEIRMLREKMEDESVVLDVCRAKVRTRLAARTAVCSLVCRLTHLRFPPGSAEGPAHGGD